MGIVGCARVPRGWWPLLSSRTGHPFAASGSREPSQMIECVFSASLETIRREPPELKLLRSVAYQQDLAACASMGFGDLFRVKWLYSHLNAD